MKAIEVKDLSKRYMLGHRTNSDTLRDALTLGVKGLWRRLRNPRTTKEEFWALRDLNFTVNAGEVVGIIGRNGAGKSTLLKILSRITEPTSGSIKIHGRVASLLEVGTGFHPELSGRENIFLNGAILGMARKEIHRKFDEIVAFAEVERFLDTPVKRYSSGMYVRLAFAVAAHLEPEILIVDEVLAVGDAAFQKKCLGKMHDVARGGRTVLFVSHNLATVQTLCSRVISLQSGALVADGLPAPIIAQYINQSHSQAPDASSAFQGKDPAIFVESVNYSPDAVNPLIKVQMTVRCNSPRKVGYEFLLTSVVGNQVGLAEHGSFNRTNSQSLGEGEHTSTWEIDASNIADGSYLVAVQIVDPGVGVLARFDYSQIISVGRPFYPPIDRVLHQDWGVGCVELKVVPTIES